MKTQLCCAALLLLTCAGRADACEYKAAMTDAEIAACRNAQDAPAPKAKRHAPRPSSTWTQEDEKSFRQKQAMESARLAAAREKDNAPWLPVIGMTADQAMQSKLVRTYCTPPHVNRTVTKYGTREQWVCTGYYLYFVNGIMTSYQEQDR